jgi:hypothetical protein
MERRRLAPALAENDLFVFFKRAPNAQLITLTTRPERHHDGGTNDHEDPGCTGSPFVMS